MASSAANISILLTLDDKATAGLNRFHQQATTGFGKLNTIIKENSTALLGFGAASLTASAGIARLMAVPAMAFADAEHALLKFKSSMLKGDGSMPPVFDDLRKQATELGNALPGTTADFYQMYTVLIEQGMKAEVVQNGLGKATAYLAVASGVGYQEMAKYMAALQDGVNLKDSDLMWAADKLSRTKNMGASAEQLASAFAGLGAAAKALKLDGKQLLNDFTPYVAALLNTGQDASAVGNALNKMMSAGMDDKKMAKANKLMRQFGQELKFVDKNGEWLGNANFFQQLDKIKKLNPKLQFNVSSELFGNDKEIKEAFGGYDPQKFAEMQKKMNEGASLNQKITLQMSGLKNLMEAASGTWTNAMVVIGEAWAPALKELAQGFNSASEAIGNFAKNHSTLTKLVGGAGGMAIGGLAVLGTASVALGAYGKLSDTWSRLRGRGQLNNGSASGVQQVYVTNMGEGGGGNIGTERLRDRAWLRRRDHREYKYLTKMEVLKSLSMVVEAGALGYAVGTVLNEGINWGMEMFTREEGATLGSKIYDWTHGIGDGFFETVKKRLDPEPISPNDLKSLKVLSQMNSLPPGFMSPQKIDGVVEVKVTMPNYLTGNATVTTPAAQGVKIAPKVGYYNMAGA